MDNIFIDIETYSGTVDLRTRGLYRYCEDVEITLVGYALNDEPARVWDVAADELPPSVLMAAVNKPEAYTFIAHNAAFERAVFGAERSWKWWVGYGKRNPWHCTMAQALLHGLPGGLQQLSDIFKLPADKAKDAEGRKLVNLFCKPRDGVRATRLTHPKEWAQFIEYCRRDVEAERELYKRIPMWNCTEAERAVMDCDGDINARGFLVDTALAEAAIEVLKKEKQDRDNKMYEASGGRVLAATQRDKMLEYLLNEFGVDLPDMNVSTLTRRLDDPDLPPPVKELLELRLLSAGTSTKKYQTLLNTVSSDGRLRGTLQYCGASRTGRWTGRIFQPQNLPRPAYGKEEIEEGIAAIKAGAADVIYDDVTSIASSALRGVIVAPEGKKLVVADLSSIEGRVLAWLAGEDWKIKAYADYTMGMGYDMYTRTYAQTFGKRPEEVTKSERQLGKVLELALGYGGGVGAFIAFANAYRIDLERLAVDLSMFEMDDKCAASRLWDKAAERGATYGLDKRVFIACDCIKQMWRKANPQIVKLWVDIEQIIKDVMHGGHNANVGKCRVSKVDAWLRLRLPSGRYLCYAGAKHGEGGKLKYLGVNPYTRRWGYTSTYGGKLAENITQAVSRDIFAHGMVKAEEAGYKVVLSVHDELITEVPDSEAFSARTLAEIMTDRPAWAPGLPLEAVGFETHRYGKD